jgi:hypothetical protein
MKEDSLDDIKHGKYIKSNNKEKNLLKFFRNC